MGRKRHSTEEILNKLRQADVDLAKGSTVTGVCRLLAISERTDYACGTPRITAMLRSAGRRVIHKRA